jgi:hypothetical protein
LFTSRADPAECCPVEIFRQHEAARFWYNTPCSLGGV